MRSVFPAPLFFCFLLGACSTPPLELATGTSDSPVFVGDVVQRVKCEISDAFVDKVDDARFPWLRRWTVTTDLTLQANVTGALNASESRTEIFHNAINRAAGPTSSTGISLGTIAQNFVFGFSGNASGTALRSDVVSFTVAIDELLEWRRELDAHERALHVPPEQMTCNPGGHRELVGKLGLKEWVDAALDPVAEKYLTAGDHPSASSKGLSRVPSGKSAKGGGQKPRTKILADTPATTAFAQYRRYVALQIAQDEIAGAERACESYGDDANMLPSKIDQTKDKIRNIVAEEKSYRGSLSPIYARETASLFKVAAAKIDLANRDKETLASNCAAVKRIALLSKDATSPLGKALTDEHKQLVDLTADLKGQQNDLYKQLIGEYHPDDAAVWEVVNEVNPQLATDFNDAKQKQSQAKAIHDQIPQLGIELDALAQVPLPEPPVTAISHEVQFEIDYGVGINPTWSLAIWKGPGLNGNLLSLNGTRMNLLQIAVGPRDEPALIGAEQKRLLDQQTLLLR